MDTPWIIAAGLALACASLPALMAVANAWYFRRAESPLESVQPEVTVCIPARNEAERIGPTLEALRRQRGVRLTVLVGDDHSSDGTDKRVAQVATIDPRVALVTLPELPKGWAGKQHALDQLGKRAATPWIAFVDADVILQDRLALARLIACAEARKFDLLSGFPRQQTHTWGEALLIPFIQFILLGFLPFFLAARRNDPSLAAGCGQLFLARREAYRAVDGHRAVKASFHDGIHLPRAFRRKGWRTGAIDGSDLATCRMYAGWGETWRGLSKNATDGMASPGAIGPFSLLLGLGQVVPALALALSLPGQTLWAIALALSTLHHLTLAIVFRQSLRGALLHPLGVALLLLLQWTAFIRRASGKPTVSWRGRSLPSSKA